MKCWTCNDIDLIWGGDEDHENEDGDLEIVTNLHCPRCGAEVFVHHGGQNELPDWVEAMEIPELNLH